MKIERSSGNVFADIGLPNAEELKALADMKMRGLFPTLSWKELTHLMRGKPNK